MPHSGGGGSHGGGSHHSSHSSHSSHHSSGGSSTPARKSGSTAFDGATRYLYYNKNRMPVFVYANYDIRNEKKRLTSLRICLLIFMIIPSIAITALITFFGAGHFPKKLADNYDTRIYVEDNLGIVTNEAALIASMQRFQDKTGITPVLVTQPNSVWKEHYSSLEDYAYEDYLNRFGDEKHFLIVYTTETAEDGFEEWYWDSMLGDDTDGILGSKETDFFTDHLHDYLLQPSRYSVDAAIAQAFDDLTPVAMKKYFDWFAICTIGFEVFFLLLMIPLMDFHPTREKNYSHAEICDPKFVDEEECDYCGGIYIVGMHLSCPHCGAPVKPHDFTLDEQGNISQVIN